ncbi:hypothetical protein HPB50_011820 [Hyalomma asiaticum]|uniref:Uncharacterized protein n=1 Tax=Hyalomma asiaticum TaxID=266040 RepID=A0ACB7RU36_HYAAI|nr:hypothetical protein HPB50_011820 [Hyalomma asiaticum]
MSVARCSVSSMWPSEPDVIQRATSSEYRVCLRPSFSCGLPIGVATKRFTPPSLFTPTPLRCPSFHISECWG